MNDKNASADNPLAPFERLIGGKWYFEGSYHVFEWGVGQKMVHTRSYFTSDGKDRLVSEGSWFFHPKNGEIKGHVAATDMGIDLFTYTTRFDGDRMLNDLTAYSEDGAVSTYLEEWVFTGKDAYEWSLYARTENGLAKAMGGTFTRKA